MEGFADHPEISPPPRHYQYAFFFQSALVDIRDVVMCHVMRVERYRFALKKNEA
jgi:hypothetical protein